MIDAHHMFWDRMRQAYPWADETVSTSSAAAGVTASPRRFALSSLRGAEVETNSETNWARKHA
jgi:predicted TIM-barrel fold metal-dependent hydrolase